MIREINLQWKIIYNDDEDMKKREHVHNAGGNVNSIGITEVLQNLKQIYLIIQLHHS
jgi:hypothetical protein